MSDGPRVAVVGGGLAGLAAALDCAARGARVTLIERRRRLGGLTWSYQRDDLTVDNGQHVFLRCCTAYRDFLRRIGSDGDVELQDRLDVTVLAPTDGGGVRSGRLRRSGLPAPLHLGAALLHYRHLPVADRLRIGRAALPLRRVDLDDPALDDETFGSWLTRHGQSPTAITALWDLICIATVNLPAAQASAAMGAKVFQTGVLTDAAAGDIGWSRVPLGRLHGERAAAALDAGRVEVRLGERIERIEAVESVAGPPGSGDGGRCGGGRYALRSASGTLDADAVIVALPHDEAASVLPAGAVAHQDRLADLGTSGIVDVHVTYDRRVTDLPLAAGINSPVQWVFDRTASSGLGSGRGPGPQYLAVSLSAADADLGRHPDDLSAWITAEVPRLLPAARQARVLDTFVTKERSATFRAGPGSARLRCGSRTALPGLAMAGAWTDTGWPATMEGAVRSGRAAARVALADAGLAPTRPEEVA